MYQKLSVMYKIFFLFTILTTPYLLLYTTAANAQTMSNDDYILQMGNLNSISGAASGGNYNLTFTSGESGQNLFSGTNYKVKAGFQYIYPFSPKPFTLSISTSSIDFGVISPTNPVTRTNTLTVVNNSSNGYAVTASQNRNLRVDASNSEIPATTCDSGNCTDTTSDAWTNTLTYGFGYRCNNVLGTDCDSGFATSGYYKKFSASPSATTVMSKTTAGGTSQSKITYKVNIPVTQAPGIYTNIIHYIATPSF